MGSKTWIGVVAALVGIAGAWFGPTLIDHAWGQILLLVSLIVFVMWVGIRVREEKRLSLLCDPLVLFFAFQAQFFVIGPLALPLFNYSRFRVTHENTVAVLVAFLLMLVTFLFGYQMHLGVLVARFLPDFGKRGMKLPGRWFETLLIAGSLLGCLAYVMDLGGLLEILRVGYGRSKSGFFLIPFHGVMLGTLLMWWRLTTSRPRRVVDVLLFAALLLTDVLFFGIFLGARKKLFFLFFGMLGIWALHRPLSKVPRYVAALALPPLLLYFSMWGMLRSRPLEHLVQGRSDPLYAQTGPVYTGYLAGVSEPFAVACLIYDVFPRTEEYRYGQTLLVTLLGFIPRDMWPDKPIGLGRELAKYTDGVFYYVQSVHSITPTMVGDCYANLGWIGILLGGLLFGVICRTVASYAAEGLEAGHQANPARVLVAAVFLAGLVEVRSDMATILAFYLMTYPFLFLGLLFFRFDYGASPVAAGSPVRPTGPVLGVSGASPVPLPES